MHYNRGRGACANTLLIARRALEEQLLTGLQERVLHSDVIGYTLDAFEEQLLLAENRSADQSALMRRRLETIQKQIRNCTDAIAEGKRYPSLMEKLAELEQELADTKAKTVYSDPRAARPRFRDTRRFVETQLAHLQSLLTGEPRIVRTEIAKHVEKITLAPEGRVYVASGTWNLLGAGAWQHGWCRGPGMHHASHRISGLFGRVTLRSLRARRSDPAVSTAIEKPN